MFPFDDDYKEGLVQEIVDDGGGEGHTATLYAYKFDNNDKLYLMNPATMEIVYSE